MIYYTVTGRSKVNEKKSSLFKGYSKHNKSATLIRLHTFQNKGNYKRQWGILYMTKGSNH